MIQLNMNNSKNMKFHWNSRWMCLMVLNSQMLNLTISNIIPNISLTDGGAGNLLAFILVFVLIGIPLIFMELHVSQYTGRDCIDIWKIRSCISHMGYIQICWQVCILFYNHAITSFLFHYFLISIQDPIPYYLCGNWSDETCNSLYRNYTLHQDCIVKTIPLSYCKDLHFTYPEYQYWMFHVLNANQTSVLRVAWHVLVASGLVCIFLFVSCMRLHKSFKLSLILLTSYPISAYFILMVGSMLQKGVVTIFEEAFDTNFSLFRKRFRPTQVVEYVLYGLKIGTGLTSNIGASSEFRSPCYSNAVMSVLISTTFAILSICTTAMLTCPYNYEYCSQPNIMLDADMNFPFEKLPRYLSAFSYRYFWILLSYSIQAFLGLKTNVILFYNILGVLRRRYTLISDYPGLVSFLGSAILFIVTIPLLSRVGVVYITSAFRGYIHLTSCCFAVIECLIFVTLYGSDRFSTDIHFMQGIKPKAYIKLVWVTISVVVTVAFCYEIYIQLCDSKTMVHDVLGLVFLLLAFGGGLLVLIMKLLIASCKRRFKEMIREIPDWGPQSDVLQRSRAMFTAYAMTKEYLYRQNHLQAKIKERQKRSNTRNLTL